MSRRSLRRRRLDGLEVGDLLSRGAGEGETGDQGHTTCLPRTADSTVANSTVADSTVADSRAASRAASSTVASSRVRLSQAGRVSTSRTSGIRRAVLAL